MKAPGPKGRGFLFIKERGDIETAVLTTHITESVVGWLAGVLPVRGRASSLRAAFRSPRCLSDQSTFRLYNKTAIGNDSPPTKSAVSATEEDILTV